jgi:D-lactate dehydrogenase (cytochrome)
MDQVLEMRPDDFVVRVQPGLRRQELNSRLKRYGLFFPVYPGADATIGGMASTNASGTNAVRYGVMKDRVLGLEVVLADGRVIRTGSMAAKSSAGYQLTNLFVGSEGTLGVITEITLKLAGIPEATVAARAVFSSLDEAGQAAVDMIHSGLMIGRVELVDALTIQAVNRYKGTSYPEQPTLFLEFSGRASSVEEELAIAKELAGYNHVQDWAEERDPERRNKLWEARHHAGLAVMALSPGTKHMATDVCVPISLLPAALKEARQIIDHHQLEAAIFGHVGDGNFHVAFNFDPHNKEEMEKAMKVNETIVEFALRHGGTCTGEHGIGLGKIKYLKKQYEQAVPIMASLKKMFDPNGILNPGKVLSREMLG